MKSKYENQASSAGNSYSSSNQVERLDSFKPIPGPVLLFDINANVDRFVFRGDSRGINEIFKRGFKAQGTNMDLFQHVYLNEGSGYVSTSKFSDIAKEYPIFSETRPSYVYDIRRSQKGIDLKPNLSEWYAQGRLDASHFEYFSGEHEIAFPEKINNKTIRGAWEVSFEPYKGAVLGEYRSNPEYRMSGEERILKYSKGVGAGLTGLTAVMDTMNLYNAYRLSEETGNYHILGREASSIAGAWIGSGLGGAIGSSAGAVACAKFSPIGSAACAVTLGAVGSFGGAVVGGISAELTYNTYIESDGLPTWNDVPGGVVGLVQEISPLASASAKPLPAVQAPPKVSQIKREVPILTKAEHKVKAQNPIENVMRQLPTEKRSAFEASYHQRLKKQSYLLSSLEKKQEQCSLELKDVLQTTRYLYESIEDIKHDQKLEQQQGEVFATLQGVNQCFNLLSQVGAMTNSKSVQIVGTVGMAVTQGAMGVAQLMAPACTGMMTLGPYGMIAGAVLSIAMSFMGGSGGKGMMKALKQISKQIANMHNDMLKGFNIIINKQKFTIELIKEGFKSIDDKLYQLLLGQQIGIEKLDDILGDLEKIKAILQKMGIEIDLEKLKKLKYQLKNLPEACDIKCDKTFKRIIAKPLTKIEEQLDKSLEPKVTMLANAKNQLPGWFHFRNLNALFQKPPFLQFNFEVNKVPNLIWWQSSVVQYFNLLQEYHGFKLGDKTKEQNLRILEQIHAPAQALQAFLIQLSDESFLKTLIKYYQNQFAHKREQLNAVLSGVSEQYGHETMLRFARQYIAHNASEKSPVWSEICDDIENQTKTVAEHHSLNTTRLFELKRQYNALIDEYHFNLTMIFSLLNIDSRNLFTVPLPVKAPDTLYRNYPVTRKAVELSKQRVWFYYLEGQFDNQFETLIWPDYLVADVCREAKDGVQSTLDYLKDIEAMSGLILMLENPMGLPLAVLEKYNSQQKDLGNLQGGKKRPHLNESEEKIMINEKMLAEAIELINPVFNVIDGLTDEMFTLIIGHSGAGKSTLLNVYTDSEYELAEDELFTPFAKLKPGHIEEFKVGSACDSETLYPKVVGDVCDSGGSGDNRGDATKICVANVLDMLVHAKPELKGLVIVADFEDFSGRAPKFLKEILRLGRIMKSNLDLINDSVGLVISKAPDKPFTPEIIQKIMIKHLNREQKKSHPSDDEELVIEVLKRLSTSKNIMVNHLFDSQKTRDQLRGLMDGLTNLSTSDLDFNASTEDQVRFNKQLEMIATQYLKFREYAAETQKAFDERGETKDLQEKILKDLMLKNETITVAQEEKREKARSLTTEIDKLDRSLKTLKEESTSLHLKIRSINQMTNPIVLKTFKISKEFQFDFKEHRRRNVNKHVKWDSSPAYNDFTRRGYTHGLTFKRFFTHPKTGEKYPKHRHKRYVVGYMCGRTTYLLDVPFEHPVSYDYTNLHNCQFDSAPTTSKGFHATVSHPNYLTSTMTITVRAQQRYLANNQRTLSQSQARLEVVEDNIARIENEKLNKDKALKKLYQEQTQSKDAEQLGENRAKIKELQCLIQTMESSVPEVKAELQHAYDQINKNAEVFATVARFAKLLETDNPLLIQFMKQYQSHDELNSLVAALIGSEGSQTKTEQTSVQLKSSVKDHSFFDSAKETVDSSCYDSDQIISLEHQEL